MLFCCLVLSTALPPCLVAAWCCVLSCAVLGSALRSLPALNSLLDGSRPLFFVLRSRARGCALCLTSCPILVAVSFALRPVALPPTRAVQRSPPCASRSLYSVGCTADRILSCSCLVLLLMRRDPADAPFAASFELATRSEREAMERKVRVSLLRLCPPCGWLDAANLCCSWSVGCGCPLVVAGVSGGVLLARCLLC